MLGLCHTIYIFKGNIESKLHFKNEKGLDTTPEMVRRREVKRAAGGVTLINDHFLRER